MNDRSDSIEYGAILSQWENGQLVDTLELVNALAWRVKNQRRELARVQAQRDEARALFATARELLIRDTGVMHSPSWTNDLREFLAQTNNIPGNA